MGRRSGPMPGRPPLINPNTVAVMGDYDPRVVRLYDQANPDGPDHDFYRTQADRFAPRTIIDLGCGNVWAARACTGSAATRHRSPAKARI